MLDNGDLEAAVRSGVVTGEVADRLRVLAATRRAAPAADEERFGVVGGLSDIMCAAGLLLLLGIALAGFASQHPMAALPVAGGAWAMAEHFTRRRRLTLTSFVLFGLFVLAWALACLGVTMLLPGADTVPVTGNPRMSEQLPSLKGMIVAGGCAMGCALWWMRFRLPIAYAATVLAGVNVLVHVGRTIAPNMPAGVVSVAMLAFGLACLALAMWWDMTDIRRETPRTDVAFWLHVIAGYQISRASFRMLIGVSPDARGWDWMYAWTTASADFGTQVAVLTLFAAFCVPALAMDRRSLVMSSLAFVLPALQGLWGGDVSGLWTALMLIGALLLLLEGSWGRLRTRLLTVMPSVIVAQLPRTTIAARGSRPVR